MKTSILFTFGLLLVFAACSKDPNDKVLTKVPTVNTITANATSISTATVSVEIISDGGSPIIEKGVCWSTDINPTINNNKVTNAESATSFSINIQGLQPNVTYYVKAFATNAKGTSYGSVLSFTTRDGIINLLGTVDSIDITTSKVSGQILSDGGSPVTEKGICWSIQNNPTIDNNKITNTDNVTSFTAKITGLQPNTNYYARTYAINAKGTSYGNVITFTTQDGVIDIDGNVYPVVKIGNQTWMAENLRVTHYKDGTTIPMVSSSDMNTPTTSDVCGWPVNTTLYKTTFGMLYNYYTVTTGKLAPTGWHVPSDAEWNTLATNLGGTSVAGGKMKSIVVIPGITNVGATNSSGFNSIPEACSTTNHAGKWWSTDVGYYNGVLCGSFFTIELNSISLDTHLGTLYYSRSIRCIKD